jgi:hypothetical protein
MAFIKQDNGIYLADDRISNVEQIERIRSNSAFPRSKKSPSFYTEVEFKNELGEVTQRGHNELLLSGGLFALSKISGVNPPINIQTINTDLGININETASGFTGPRREDTIIGFMIGIDGCTDVFDTVAEVQVKQRNIASLVPFRMVETAYDLTATERQKYNLKVSASGYNKYYLKGFETTPVIKCEFDEPGNPPVPANVDTLPTDSVINKYLEYVLKINVNDVREFFELIGGGLRKARVNTLGLVTGYWDATANDYKGCRLFSRINFNNEAFDNETKELTVIYKIYI